MNKEMAEVLVRVGPDTPMGKLYLAYLRDPDGNKLCALHRPAP